MWPTLLMHLKTGITRRIAMASFNKITLVGYLGRDPELRYTPQGVAVCNINVATTERRKDTRTGEPQDVTTWFRVSLWRRQAEIANQYLSKGKQVYIEGRLRQEEYTDRDGVKRTSLVVDATDMQFLGPRGDEAGEGFSRPAQGQRPSGAPEDEFEPPHDNDIPF
jgi:single-strand DNA-binding protein